MAQATMTVRTDAAVKEQFTRLCEQFGMSVNTAMNVFMRAVMEAQCIPFQIGLGRKANATTSTTTNVELQTLYKKLSAMQNLTDDWDIYGTPVPSVQCINEARQLIDLLPAYLLCNVSLEPSEWGGVSIRIDNSNGRKLSIRILDSGITWYAKGKNGTEFHEEEPCSGKVYQEIVNSISFAA